MAFKPTINFTCLAFKELLNSNKSRLKLVFKIKNSTNFLQDELLQAVWNYCVTNRINPLEYNSFEEIELVKGDNELYFTGYDGIVLTKEQAFNLTNLLQEDYQGLINLNLVFTQRTYPPSRFLTKDFSSYNFSSFLALFTAFGLHLEENKQLLNYYLEKLNITHPESNQQYFFKLNNIKYYKLLNVILERLRVEKINDDPLDYDLVLSLFRRSISGMNEYGLVARLLGVLPSSLRGCNTKPYSTYILDRFVNLFNITDEQLHDVNFTVVLDDNIKEFIKQTPEDRTIINPRVSVLTEKIPDVLSILYYAVLDFVGGDFLEDCGISRSSVKRTLRRQTSALNFCYKLLLLLNLNENDELLSVLFHEEANNGISEPSEIEEQHLEEPNNYSPIQALGKLNTLPQTIQAFYKKLDLSVDSNGNEKQLPSNYPTYLNQKIKNIFQNNIPKNLCIVTQLLTTDGVIFKDEQIIALSIGQVFEFASENDFAYLKTALNKPTYVYLLSQVGNLELKVLSMDLTQSTITFHDFHEENDVMYQQELKTFLKYFEKLIIIYDVDYI